MRRILWLLFLAWFVLLCHSDSREEQDILLEFKGKMRHDPLGVLSDWVPDSNMHCNWTGITCDFDNRVQSIDLEGNNLQGVIPPSVANLSQLINLNLGNNSFHGEIPSSIGMLQNLQTLCLKLNQLEGTIPQNITALTKLRRLRLGSNNLHGPIPRNIGLMSSLQYLSLAKNNITGPIPSAVTNLSSLEFIALFRTNIQGTIPRDLGRLTNLKHFFIFEVPGLNGPLPESLTNISGLEEVDLHKNSLTGKLPDFGLFRNISVLYLSDNAFSGIIPPSVGNCSQLWVLDVGNNQLAGVVPDELGRLPELISLHVSGNGFVNGDNSGLFSILEVLANCSKLRILDMSSNSFNGRLRSRMPMSLSVLKLSKNLLSGAIPWNTLASLKNLSNLDLSSNLFTGMIDRSVGEIKVLQGLALDNNRLQGPLPDQIGQLNYLTQLSISNNFISGAIPYTIKNMVNLRKLVLDHNKLSSSIPASLGECTLLEMLDLSGNKLSGPIPPKVVNLQNIQVLFNLSNNLLSGHLPPEIGKMIHALEIDLSVNKINGSIPAAIANCEELQFLTLSHNEFQGMIPESLSELTSLISIDLSHNNLSGPIPSSLGKIQTLKSLNMSYNNLSGQIPGGGAFSNLTLSSFLGNPFLCGKALASCPIKSHSKSKIPVIVSVAVVVGVVFCMILLGFIFYFRKGLPKNFNDLFNDPGYWLGPMSVLQKGLISFEEINGATNGFRRENLLGSSILGSVYKGVLRNGVPVAIKIFNAEMEEALKSFRSECRVLIKVKHRNLVKIFGLCSEGEHRAIVMQLMPKGNLEQALRSKCLGLDEIVRISVDVAHALEYLHHLCHVQIVHCDIKPSNILLDDNMVAHVSDFGISRLLLSSDSRDSFASTLALRGSIGYIPPEYGVGSNVSVKGDVYSFGIMILEMVTGKSPTDIQFHEGISMQKWVERAFPDSLEEVVQKKMWEETKEDYRSFQGMVSFVRIGLLCCSQLPKDRPSMNHAGSMLEAILGTATAG